MPVILFSALVVAKLALLGIGAHYLEHESLNSIYCLLALFLSTNLLISAWEICLFSRRDHIECRRAHWLHWREETDRSPAVAFLMSKVPLRNALSPTFWADIWAVYSLYDGSYADRRTFGFNADIGNGFLTLIPTAFLYLAFTVELMPATYAGILGIALFWQWTYVTSLYWVSFLVAGRQRQLSKRELCVYILSPNVFWILLPILGLYASFHLIVDGHYGILGH